MATNVYDPQTYAFVMLCSAVKFRKKTGQSMLKGKEALMARNHGWSNAARFGDKLVEDLNNIRATLELPLI